MASLVGLLEDFFKRHGSSKEIKIFIFIITSGAWISLRFILNVVSSALHVLSLAGAQWLLLASSKHPVWIKYLESLRTHIHALGKQKKNLLTWRDFYQQAEDFSQNWGCQHPLFSSVLCQKSMLQVQLPQRTEINRMESAPFQRTELQLVWIFRLILSEQVKINAEISEDW